MRHLPFAFTEHGALQAANVLKSDRAAAMSLYVIRAFIQMREQIATNSAILKRLVEIDRTVLEHDGNRLSAIRRPILRDRESASGRDLRGEPE